MVVIVSNNKIILLLPHPQGPVQPLQCSIQNYALVLNHDMIVSSRHGCSTNTESANLLGTTEIGVVCEKTSENMQNISNQV